MNAPLIFITTHTVKHGRLDDLTALNTEFAAFVEQHEPDMLGLHAYLDRDGTRLTIIQIHPDADALEHHLRVAGEKIHQAIELVDNDRVDAGGAQAEPARASNDVLATPRMTWEPPSRAHSFPAMTNTLSSALAHAIVEDRLRSAHEHRSHRATAGLARLRVALATVNRRLPLGTRHPLPC